MKIKIKFHENQFKIFDDPHRFKVVRAGRRFGKSFLLRFTIIKWAVENPGLYWIVVPTFDMGKKIHWLQGFKEEVVGEFASLLGASFNEAELSISLSNGSTIQIVSAENPDRLIGVKLRGLGVDEIATMTKWNRIWQQGLRATLTDYKAPAIFISSPRGYNHFFDLCNKEKLNDSYKTFHFTSYDNPNIDPKEIDEARDEIDLNYFNQEYMAEFTKYTGLVYKEFDDKMIKPLDFKPIYWLRGLDRGYRNPTAIPIIAVDENDNWHQVFEIYETELTNSDIKKRLDSIRDEIYKVDPHFVDFEYSTGDSEAIGDLNDLYDNFGEYFEPVKKSSGESKLNYVAYKIQKFAQRLKEGKFTISPECEMTIFEFKSYAYSEEKTSSEAPIKDNDHAMDALADINLMYQHYYLKTVPQKLKGTYIEPFRSYSQTQEEEIDMTNEEFLGQEVSI
jgi:hypothetical protein